jgi:hypothetical protein
MLDPFRALGVDRAFSNGETFSAASYRHGDGRVRSLACRAVPMIVSGKTVDACVIAKDVTEASRLASLVAEQSKRTHPPCLIAASDVADQIDIERPDDVETLATQVVEVLCRPYDLEGRSFEMGCQRRRCDLPDGWREASAPCGAPMPHGIGQRLV